MTMPEFVSKNLKSAQERVAALRKSTDAAVKQAREAAVKAGNDLVARVSAKLPENVKARLTALQAEAAKQAGKIREQGEAVGAKAKTAVEELRKKTTERVEQAEKTVIDLRARALRRVGLVKEEAAAPAEKAAETTPANAPESKSAAQA